MDIAARIARTWERNPNFQTGEYSKDRWDHEDQLAQHVKTWQRRRHYVVFNHLPWLVRCRATAILGPLRRVFAAGNWWEPRAHTDPETGFTTTKVYLPEDARSAAGLVHWGITKLEEIYRQALGTGRKTTPHSKPKGTATPSDTAQMSLNDLEERSAFFEMLRKLDRAGPGLTVAR